MARGGPPVQPRWGRTIQQRREERGWSLRWAAQQSGMSDVFWAQMERGWKRRSDGSYQEVKPSIGSLLQAAAALRFSAAEIDQLVISAGHQPLPRRLADGTDGHSVPQAIQNDPDLLDEAKEHLLSQYELLRRLAPAPRKEVARSRAAESIEDRRARLRAEQASRHGTGKKDARRSAARGDMAE